MKAASRNTKVNKDQLQKDILHDLEEASGLQSPPPVPDSNDKATKVDEAEKGFFAKAKDLGSRTMTSIKGFFTNLWAKIKGFFSKDGMKKNLGNVKMVAQTAGILAITWMVGSWLIGIVGVSGVAIGGMLLGAAAYAGKRYLDYRTEKENNPNAKMELDFQEAFHPLAA